MASEFDKPNGICVLHEADLQTADLAAGLPQGQRHRPEGRRKAGQLRHHTIGDIGRAAPAWLVRAASARPTAPGCTTSRWGRDERPVVTESEPVSMSRETTFERDLHAVRDRAELGRHLHRPVRAGGRATCSARAMWAAPSASSCATTTSAPSRATRRWTIHRRCRDHPPRRGPMPQARGPDAAPAPAGRARGQARQGRLAAGARAGAARGAGAAGGAPLVGRDRGARHRRAHARSVLARCLRAGGSKVAAGRGAYFAVVPQQRSRV